MRCVPVVVALLVLSIDHAASQLPPAPACPVTTQVENTAVARAWHEDVINRRNPAVLQQLLAPEVVLHAAGGYPKRMNASGIAAMMDEFLSHSRTSSTPSISSSRKTISSSSATPRPERSMGSSATYRHRAASPHGRASTSSASSVDASPKSGHKSMP
jgi:hypothetical protein